jgi:uncharacterized protein YjbI with pentapeptide repeats
MLQEFSCQNLLGRSFKGQNLTGVNFSGADIRGTDFSIDKNFDLLQFDNQTVMHKTKS